MSLRNGFGDTGVASIVEKVVNLGVSGEYANNCTIRSNGSGTLFVMVNGDTQAVADRYGDGTTIQVFNGESYTFNSGGKWDDIRSVGFRTDTGTTGYVIGAY